MKIIDKRAKAEKPGMKPEDLVRGKFYMVTSCHRAEEYLVYRPMHDGSVQAFNPWGDGRAKWCLPTQEFLTAVPVDVEIHIVGEKKEDAA